MIFEKNINFWYFRQGDIKRGKDPGRNRLLEEKGSRFDLLAPPPGLNPLFDFN